MILPPLRNSSTAPNLTEAICRRTLRVSKFNESSLREYRMKVSRLSALASFLFFSNTLFAQTPAGLKPFVKEDSPILVLDHVRVIDGTGAAPMEDQRIDIENGKITRVQSAKQRNAYPPNAKILDLTG